MAINRADRYPGRWETETSDYPLGGPKNRTSSTSKDGSYFEKDWISDYEAFFGALLSEADESPNGIVDTAQSSQLFDALKSMVLSTRVGYRVEIHSSNIPSWLVLADGSSLSRVTDDLLWEHASNSGLLVAQSLKDANPEQYAMYYGDGDGSATFTTPNWYLGHFARGNPSGVSFGETQGDAIRNITGSVNHVSESFDKSGSATGVFQKGGGNLNDFTPITTDTSTTGYFDFDASLVVPTADENRPKTGNINICIERGKA